MIGEDTAKQVCVKSLVKSINQQLKLVDRDRQKIGVGILSQ